MTLHAAAAERQQHRGDAEGTRPAWNRIAPGYDMTVTPTHMGLGHEGLRRAGLRAGMRFLDVAAGIGTK